MRVATLIVAGIQFGSMEFLRESQKRGVRFLLYSNDVTVLLDGYRQALAVLKGGN